jgi:hypothetical protein
MKYGTLLGMTFLSFIFLYLLMYSMVDSTANVYFNLNQFYMAGIMTIPMVLIELFLMRSMYKNKKLNKLISFVSLAAFVILFALLRNQTAIGNKEFLKSMIPHHAGALL